MDLFWVAVKIAEGKGRQRAAWKAAREVRPLGAKNFDFVGSQVPICFNAQSIQLWDLNWNAGELNPLVQHHHDEFSNQSRWLFIIFQFREPIYLTFDWMKGALWMQDVICCIIKGFEAAKFAAPFRRPVRLSRYGGLKRVLMRSMKTNFQLTVHLIMIWFAALSSFFDLVPYVQRLGGRQFAAPKNLVMKSEGDTLLNAASFSPSI